MNVLTAEHASLLKAAIGGDRAAIDALDRAELAALPMFVRPHYADGEFYLPAPSLKVGLVLWPTDLARGVGPNGETLVTWCAVKPCGRCWLALSRRATCRKCFGKGHLNDEWEDEVYTNLDGLIIKHGDGSPVI